MPRQKGYCKVSNVTDVRRFACRVANMLYRSELSPNQSKPIGSVLWMVLETLKMEDGLVPSKQWQEPARVQARRVRQLRRLWNQAAQKASREGDAEWKEIEEGLEEWLREEEDQAKPGAGRGRGPTQELLLSLQRWGLTL